MKSYIKYIFFAILACSSIFSSCIENDVPYPVVKLCIEKLEGEGFTTKEIDNDALVYTLDLEETTNIHDVNISKAEVTDKAFVSNCLVGHFDLSDSLEVNLFLYQNYLWRIVAEQQIERYFKVDGQIGDEVIDEKNRTITAYVSESVDLLNVNVKSLKVGPKDISTITPEISNLTQFLTFRKVELKYHDITEVWKLFVVPTDVKVVFTKCEAWAKTAWLEAAAETSNICGFRYRLAGETTWIEVDPSDVTVGDGVFSAQIKDLTPGTEYEFLAYSGEDVTAIESRVSDLIIPLENGGFENWHKSGKSWFPYFETDTPFWSTGNEGATTIGDSYNLTTGVEGDTRPGSKGVQSAQLKSRNVLVKFAAGNLFIGDYIATDITNGIVGFGQPFKSRPTALKGWFKYSGGVIDCVGTVPPGVNIVKNETKDAGMIYIALGDWTPEEYGLNPAKNEIVGTAATPVVIHTKFSNTFFDPKGKNVIAYGEKVVDKDVSEWTEFTIPLDYTDISRIPTNIIIVCSASRYGDYFTGSSNSVMLLDDFELVY